MRLQLSITPTSGEPRTEVIHRPLTLDNAPAQSAAQVAEQILRPPLARLEDPLVITADQPIGADGARVLENVSITIQTGAGQVVVTALDGPLNLQREALVEAIAMLERERRQIVEA